jgi:prepilin-type N-terminal cleavage/methylation domain-containing protein
MTSGHRQSEPAGFTLIELLVVIGIISLLVTILMPSLSQARELARTSVCQSNLHSLALAMGLYQHENDGSFWPYVLHNHPEPGTHCYFWGTNTDPVDRTLSPFLSACEGDLRYLWCPSLPWGSYVPQAGVHEPTTNYGYNAFCLDPRIWGRTDESGEPLPRKRAGDLNCPSELFVFADSAMYWAPAGVSIFQNSTSLDPVTLGAWGPNLTPTTHFRHRGLVSALCGDGHAAGFGLEGGNMMQPKQMLGFVGKNNVPHYDQE